MAKPSFSNTIQVMVMAILVATMLLISSGAATAMLNEAASELSLGRRTLLTYNPTGRGGYNKYNPTGRGGYNKYYPTGRGGYNKYDPTGRGGYH